MPERLNGPVSKTGVGATLPGVQIPLSPPFKNLSYPLCLVLGSLAAVKLMNRGCRLYKVISKTVTKRLARHIILLAILALDRPQNPYPLHYAAVSSCSRCPDGLRQ